MTEEQLLASCPAKYEVAETLKNVLLDECRRGRVTRTEEGDYALVPDKFEVEQLAALRTLFEPPAW